MSHACHQLAHRFHLLGPAELLLGRPQIELGLPLNADVFNDRERAGGGAIGTADDGDSHPTPKQRAILTPVPLLALVKRVGAGDELGETLPFGLGVIWMVEGAERHLGARRARVTEHALQSGIDPLDFKETIQERGAERRVFPGGSQLRFARSKSGRGPIPAGDNAIGEQGHEDEDGQRLRLPWRWASRRKGKRGAEYGEDKGRQPRPPVSPMGRHDDGAEQRDERCAREERPGKPRDGHTRQRRHNREPVRPNASSRQRSGLRRKCCEWTSQDVVRQYALIFATSQNANANERTIPEAHSPKTPSGK